jgi:hypothetical protein
MLFYDIYSTLYVVIIYKYIISLRFSIYIILITTLIVVYVPFDYNHQFPVVF